MKQMELPRSPGRFQDPTTRRLPLCYFATMPSLVMFDINFPESILFDNSEIMHLATICPAIEELKLRPQARWPANLALPSITLVSFLNGIILSHPLITRV